MKATDKKIEKIFNEYYEGKISGKKVSIQKLMLKYGYSPNSAAICGITRSNKWQSLLDSIDDEPFIDKLKDIALNSKNDADAIRAIKEVLRLKNRYPEQQKQPKNLFQTQINNLLADDDEVIPATTYEDKQISGDK